MHCRSLALLCLLTSMLLSRIPASAQTLPLQEIETVLRESTPGSKRQQFDDLQSATKYWYESRNPANLPAMDEALKRVLPIALELTRHVKDFTTWEEAQFVKPYHYAGGILLAKSYTLLYYGRLKEAAESVRLLEEKLPYAMVLSSDRGVIWARKALRYHQHAIALYLAMAKQKLDTFSFPEERDEFDEPEQLRALEDQVRLRLKEGDPAMIEYLIKTVRKLKLRTTAGKWVEDTVLDSVEPISDEAHSESAWKEMHDAVKRWQLVFPKSKDAKLAEAGFHINHANYLLGRERPYSDYREDVEKALVILKDNPEKTMSWFTLQTRAMIAAGRPIDDVMMTVKENLTQYPDHGQPICDACVLMAAGNEESRQTCGQFLNLLCQQPNKEIAARVLNVLARLNRLEGVKERLDPELVDDVMRETGEKWSQSLSLRNEFARLCLQAGLRDTAHLMLSGIEEHWSHIVWWGKKDVLQQIISRKPKDSGTITPAAAAVKFKAWLPAEQK